MNDLIAPKPVSEFQPDEYHRYVSDMYALRVKRGGKVPAVPGLSVSRTKAGALSVRRGKARAFDYVTMPEIALLAKAAGTGQADIWNAFKKREFIIAKDRLEAERVFAEREGNAC